MSVIRRIVAVLLVAVLAAAPAIACCSEESLASVRLQAVKATIVAALPARGLTSAESASDCDMMNGVFADQLQDGERPCPGCADFEMAFVSNDIVTVKSVDNQQAPQVTAVAQSIGFGALARASTQIHRLPRPTALLRQPTPITLNDVLLI